tara:strand:- start:10903 stop:11271 length:369 start_codon:yes stop_codon:yes gene_type:complete
MGITNSKPAPAKTVIKKAPLSVYEEMMKCLMANSTISHLPKWDQLQVERTLFEWLYNTIWARTGQNLSIEEKRKYVGQKMVTLGFAPNTPLPRGSLEKETQKACMDLFAHLVEQNKEVLEKL